MNCEHGYGCPCGYDPYEDPPPMQSNPAWAVEDYGLDPSWVPTPVRVWYDDLPDAARNPFVIGTAAVGAVALGVALYMTARRLPSYIGLAWAPSGPVGAGYFRWEQLNVSTAASKMVPPHPNTITSAARPNLERLVTQVLDPLYVKLGGDIHVNSGYRHPDVNRAVGGSSSSQHMTGEALDLGSRRFQSSADFAKFIIASGVPFDQLVWYKAGLSGKGHVHVSLKASKNRRLVTYNDGSRYYNNVMPGQAPASSSGSSSSSLLSWLGW